MKRIQTTTAMISAIALFTVGCSMGQETSPLNNSYDDSDVSELFHPLPQPLNDYELLTRDSNQSERREERFQSLNDLDAETSLQMAVVTAQQAREEQSLRTVILPSLLALSIVLLLVNGKKPAPPPPPEEELGKAIAKYLLKFNDTSKKS